MRKCCAIAESVPDHSSFWRFRQTLERLSLMDKLLSEINAQLSSQGLYIKSGGASIVDASVIEAKQFNRLHSGTRCTVERVFGVLKLHYDMAKARYMGLNRNRTRFELMCVAHNIKRGLSIRQYSCA